MINYTEEARKQWSADPAGAVYSRHPRGSSDFFSEVREKRYREHYWLLDAIRSTNPYGKKVLEIGAGMGTDSGEFARLGGEVTALDLVESNIELIKKKFAAENLSGNFIAADCTKLPFEDESFDIVYSMGVLHHVPETENAIAEAHRILKKGGTAKIILYHRNSLFYLYCILTWLYKRFVKGQRMSFRERLSRIEYRADAHAMPLVKVYSRAQARTLCRNFAGVAVEVAHLTHLNHHPFRGAFADRYLRVPTRLLHSAGRLVGWYVIVTAKK